MRNSGTGSASGQIAGGARLRSRPLRVRDGHLAANTRPEAGKIVELSIACYYELRSNNISGEALHPQCRLDNQKTPRNQEIKT
jgi:hypothetical protein